MTITKWFDRQFDFNFGTGQYAALLERLRAAPASLAQAVAAFPEPLLQWQPEGKWSVKEHIGHLVLLEPLWQLRFREIRESLPMSPADLSNTATTNAGFNNLPLQELLDRFAEQRDITIGFLGSLEQEALSRSSLHPRLQQPMRMVDFMYFVAEHDDHHLQHIRAIAAQDV